MTWIKLSYTHIFFCPYSEFCIWSQISTKIYDSYIYQNKHFSLHCQLNPLQNVFILLTQITLNQRLKVCFSH